MKNLLSFGLLGLYENSVELRIILSKLTQLRHFLEDDT